MTVSIRPLAAPGGPSGGRTGDRTGGLCDGPSGGRGARRPSGRPGVPPAGSPGHDVGLRLPAACCVVAASCDAGTAAAVPGTVIDEHLAVDADRCRDEGWLCAADVLYGSRIRTRALALDWLEGLTTRFRGCYVAATPVTGGWWVARFGASGRVVRVSAGPLAPVASCLHGWAVAGGGLDRLGEVDGLESLGCLDGAHGQDRVHDLVPAAAHGRAGRAAGPGTDAPAPDAPGPVRAPSGGPAPFRPRREV